MYKSFRSFSNVCFCLVCLDCFSFSIFRDHFVCVLAGVVQLVCWSHRVLLSFSFNSLNAFQDLSCYVFFISSSPFLLRPYDVTTTSNLLFVHSFMQFQLKCVRDVIFRFFFERVFFICVIKVLITWLTSLTNLTSSL